MTFLLRFTMEQMRKYFLEEVKVKVVTRAGWEWADTIVVVICDHFVTI